MLAHLVSPHSSPLPNAIYAMNIRGRKDRKTLFGFTLSYRDSSVFERLNLASLGSLSNVFHQDELDHRNLLWRVERGNLPLTRGPTFSFAVYTAPRPQFKLPWLSAVATTAARPRNPPRITARRPFASNRNNPRRNTTTDTDHSRLYCCLEK